MKIVYIIAVIIAVLFTSLLKAQTNSVTSKARAEITSLISLSDNSGLPGGSTLSFGTIAKSEGVGTVTISTLNARTTSGAVNAMSASATSTASFLVNGGMGRTYAITLPSTNVDVTRTGGTETMSITDFKARPQSIGGDQVTGTLDTQGADSFTVGATLNVGANQAEGVYEGSFNVVVNYN